MQTDLPYTTQLTVDESRLALLTDTVSYKNLKNLTLSLYSVKFSKC
jgi:hypothetical protein